MRSKKKVIPLTVKKRTKVKLKCEADANPRPTFTWHKNSELISSGFNSSWNASILIVQHAGDEDFARFVCTASNRVGWNAMEFIIQHATGIFWNLSSRSVEKEPFCWFDGWSKSQLTMVEIVTIGEYLFDFFVISFSSSSFSKLSVAK